MRFSVNLKNMECLEHELEQLGISMDELQNELDKMRRSYQADSKVYASIRTLLKDVEGSINGGTGDMRELAKSLQYAVDTYKRAENQILQSENVKGGSIQEAGEAAINFLAGIKRWLDKTLDDIGRVIRGLFDKPSIYTGDPVNMSTGGFVDLVKEIAVSGVMPLEFSRCYNSIGMEKSVLGVGWNHNYDTYLEDKGDSVIIRRGLGSIDKYVLSENGKYVSVYGSYDYVTGTKDGYLYYSRSDHLLSFDKHGRLIRQSDPLGNAVVFSYEEGRLISAECNGAKLCYTYENDQLIRVEDHTGRAVIMRYEEGLLTGVTSADGSVMSYMYGHDGRIAAVVGKNGHVQLENQYDEQGRVTAQTFADGSQMKYEYQNGSVIFTDRNGRKTEYICDERMRPVKIIFPNGSECYEYNEKNERIRFTDKMGNVYRRTFSKTGDILSYIDPDGNELRMNYDSEGHLIEELFPDGSKRTREYDSRGMLIAVTDEEGNRTSWEYTSLGKICRMVNPTGTAVSYEYDSRGNLIKYVDENQASVCREYDELNRVTKIVNARGFATAFRYDAADRIIEVKNAKGQTCVREYTAGGKLKREKDFDGFSVSYDYDRMERVIGYTDKMGRTTRYKYDCMGNICETINPDGGRVQRIFDRNNLQEKVIDPEGGMIQYSYDGGGHRIERRIGEQITRYEYDSLGRMIAMINPRGGRRMLDYDVSGNVIRMTDESGGVYQYEYDLAGHCVKRRDPAGYELFYAHDASGKLTSVRDAQGREICYTYDPKGNLLEVKYPDKSRIRFRYDENGNPVERMGETGYTCYYAYDELDRMEKLWDNLGNRVDQRSDVNGHLLWRKDARGAETYYEYSPSGKLLKVTDSLGSHTLYGYDDMDRMTAVLHASTDEKEAERVFSDMRMIEGMQNEENTSLHLTTYRRDKTGRITLIKDALGRERLYEYDPLGQLVLYEDPDGFRTCYQYDRGGEVSQIRYDDGREVKFFYDRMNRMVRMQDWSGTKEFAYDPLGRLAGFSGGPEGALCYRWDESGNLISLDYDDGDPISLRWDKNGLLSEVSGGGAEVSWRYGEDGLSLEKNMGDALCQRYRTEPTGQLKSLACYDRDRLFYSEQFTYDRNGNPISRRGIDRDGKEEYVEFRYDMLNRLTQVLRNGGESRRYEYDSFGNRTRITQDGRVTECQYNALNQLVRDECLDGDVRTIRKYAYDRRGNLVRIDGTDGKRIMEYDCTGKLVSADSADGIKSNFAYDGMGNRISEIRRNGHDAAAEEIYYLTDYSRKVPRIAGIKRGKKLEKYAWGKELLFGCCGAVEYYFCGHQGSVLFRQMGDEREAYTYDDFGRTMGDVPPVFGYTGLLANPAVHGYLTAGRIYMPDNGRFANRDDERYWNSEYPESLNLYAYCLNNPVLFVDLLGNDCYYFYLPEFNMEADRDVQRLVTELGIPATEIHMVRVTDNQSFQDGWNGMGTLKDGTKVDIDTVIVNSHANHSGLLYGSSSKDILGENEIRQLHEKKMDQLILYGCNAGHADYPDTNVAAQFSRRISGAPVIASDGTVSAPSVYGGYLSKNDSNFKEQRVDPDSDRDNLGWMIYQNNGGNIYHRTLGKKRTGAIQMIELLNLYQAGCLDEESE